MAIGFVVNTTSFRAMGYNAHNDEIGDNVTRMKR
jgi:hypothetical protein